ncbi:acyl-CoA dehydrogenase [Aeromicrobium sp.]|uniref:acyl-CoA dehydrogenase n=1 Tax=Aeromicrobium sp. TaxID=1871063 RepID=UPI003C619258
MTHTRDAWPVPGAGDTAGRWSLLVALASDDLPLVKLVEPHHDAMAILSELDVQGLDGGGVWAVWAAEPPFAVLTGIETAAGWELSGTKAFCSGASLVSHALVTAETPAGSRLFAIERGAVGIEEGDGPAWTGAGMSRANTRTLSFAEVPAIPVGSAGAYVDRPGFWLGGIGIAACWLGGARRVAQTLENASGRLDPHGRAHLGAVRSALDVSDLAFEAAASMVDRRPVSVPEAERLAQSLRAHAAHVVELVVSHVGRALGPAPLAFDAEHAEHVADLEVFVRQHHAERDLARLGSTDSDE